MPLRIEGPDRPAPRKKKKVTVRKPSPAPRRRSPDAQDASEGRGPRSPEVRRQFDRDRQEETRRRIPTATHAKMPPRRPMTRQEQLELAVDLFINENEAIRESARRTGLSPFARDWVFGRALSEPGFDPSDPWEYLDVAAMLPFGRPVAATRAAARGAAALRKGTKAAREAARKEYGGPGILRRVGGKPWPGAKRGRTGAELQAAARAAREPEKTALKRLFLGLPAREARLLDLLRDEAGQAKIDLFLGGEQGVRQGLENQLGFAGETSARSITGRALENVIDRNRDLFARTGLVRDSVEKAGERFGEHARFMRQYRMYPAVRLRNAAKRLRATDMVALRIIGEGVDPERRIQYHLDKAAEGVNPVLHSIQAELVAKAAKHIDMSSGVPALAADAPRRMRNLDKLFADNAEAREALYKEMGVLSDEVIAGRVNAPGAAITGAQWVENEVWARTLLQSSPKRTQLREFLVGAGIHVDQVDAFLRAVADPSARRHLENMQQFMRAKVEADVAAGGLPESAKQMLMRNVERSLRDSVDLLYQRLSHLVYGQPEDFPEETMLQLLDAAGPPAFLDSSLIAERALVSGLPIPPALQSPEKLAAAIDRVYELVKRGEQMGGRDWYRRAAEGILRVTEYVNAHPAVAKGKRAPLTVHQVAQVFAILSAEDNTVNNVTQTRKAITQWFDHGEVHAGRRPTMRSPEIKAVLTGGNWEGRKRSSFYQNIIDEIDGARRGEDPVTVDRWVVRMFDPDNWDRAPGQFYDVFEQIVRDMGRQLGWRAKEVQAAAWTAMKHDFLEQLPRRTVLHKAGAKDAFEYGISRNFEQMQLPGVKVTNPRALRALALAQKHGGVTLHSNLKPYEAKTGFGVALGPYETKIPIRKFTADHIEGYRDAHKAILKRGLYVGVWFNPDDGMVYLDISKSVKNREEALEFAREQGQIAIWDSKAGEDIPSGLSVEEADSIKARLRSDIDAGLEGSERVRTFKDLEGLPSKGAHSPEAQTLADAYMRGTGQRHNRPRVYIKVDPARARRIAEAFDEMVDARDPAADPDYVRATLDSYDAFVQETLDQWAMIQRGGYTFEFMPAGEDPYGGSPWAAMRDLRDNKHLYVFSTDEGFGTLSTLDEAHPLMADTGLRWMQDGVEKPVLANDLFRGVHDFFGHFKEGVGFRADGEENAWRSHAAMYSERARPAMTTETRGQNSWVNYGPHGEANRGANQLDTVYADQKVGILPEWAWREGAKDPSVEAAEAATAWEGLIDTVIRQQEWPKTQLSRQVAVDWLAENPEAFPGWEVLYHEAQRAKQASYPDWARPDLGDLRPASPTPWDVDLTDEVVGAAWRDDEVAALRASDDVWGPPTAPQEPDVTWFEAGAGLRDGDYIVTVVAPPAEKLQTPRTTVADLPPSQRVTIAGWEAARAAREAQADELEQMLNQYVYTDAGGEVHMIPADTLEEARSIVQERVWSETGSLEAAGQAWRRVKETSNERLSVEIRGQGHLVDGPFATWADALDAIAAHKEQWGLGGAVWRSVRGGVRNLEKRRNLSPGNLLEGTPEDQLRPRARGFIRPAGPGEYMLGMAPYMGDVITAVHEWGHFLRSVNTTPGRLKRLGDWAGFDFQNLPEGPADSWPEGTLERWLAAEEKIAEGFTIYVMTGGGRGMDKEARDNMKVLSDFVEETFNVRDEALAPPAAHGLLREMGVDVHPNRRKTFEVAGLHEPWDTLPEPIRDVFDFWLSHKELTGGQFRGGDFADTGRFRVPYERGLPIPVWRPLKLARAWIAMRRSGTIPGSRGAMGAGGQDPTLNHIFKAALLGSGLFKADVMTASVRDMQKAANLMSISELRKAVLAVDEDGAFVMARELPERGDDVAVKLNPKKDSPQELQAVHDMLRDAEGEVRKISKREIEQADWDIFEGLAKSVFPDQIDGKATTAIASAMLDEGLAPIDNIVWVPRRFLQKTQLFDVPQALQATNPLLTGGRITADLINDYLKTSLLYLNPAYYGMNLTGNLVMGLMQQGVFMPLNLSRAFWLSHQMGEETAFIDFLMGRGMMSVADLRSLDRIAGGAKVSSAMSHLAGAVVDMIPRRAAFLHEARRAGYRNADAIRGLLNDPDELYQVVTRAKRAMVDFDNLSQFERDVLSRYIFVYPWLKGATSWTLRFPLDHPIQTAALMWAYERQQSLAGEHVGDRPTYLDLVLPVGTAERYGEKYPLIMNMRQVFTASTPYEIGQNLLAFSTGNPNGQALSEMLQPWYGSLVTSITGYDPFKGQEVERGLPTLVASLDPHEWPGIQSIQRVMRSDEERQQDAELGRLYPRNRLDDILRLGLGSIAPTPVNPETARKYAQVGPKTGEMRLQEWIDESKAATGEEPNPYYVAVKANKIRYNEVLSEIRKEKRTRDLEDRDLVEAKIRVYEELNPGDGTTSQWRGWLEETPDEKLDRWNDFLEKALGWDRFSEYEQRVTKFEEAGVGTQP